ncbi:MAG: type VI secretion system contractile sheath small subunit [bacterium]|nr:type VI secretion system contractile sheath small subunit [bacterium]
MTDQAYEKSRINISYQSKLKGGENVKLPLRMLVMGKFNPNSDDPEQPLGERRKWSVDKGTFNKVMSEMGTNIEVNVADKLHEGAEQGMLKVKLRFNGRGDFEPNAIIEQVDSLREMREVRDEVKRLAGEMTKSPAVAKRLTAILKDPGKLEQFLAELKSIDNKTDGK